MGHHRASILVATAWARKGHIFGNGRSSQVGSSVGILVVFGVIPFSAHHHHGLSLSHLHLQEFSEAEGEESPHQKNQLISQVLHPTEQLKGQNRNFCMDHMCSFLVVFFRNLLVKICQSIWGVLLGRVSKGIMILYWADLTGANNRLNVKPLRMAVHSTILWCTGD